MKSRPVTCAIWSSDTVLERVGPLRELAGEAEVGDPLAHVGDVLEVCMGGLPLHGPRRIDQAFERELHRRKRRAQVMGDVGEVVAEEQLPVGRARLGPEGGGAVAAVCAVA